jgi:hypothetical protein
MYTTYSVLVQDVESALSSGPAAAGQQLQQLHARCVLQLEELTELVRGPLSSLERKVGRRTRAKRQCQDNTLYNSTFDLLRTAVHVVFCCYAMPAVKEASIATECCMVHT